MSSGQYTIRELVEIALLVGALVGVSLLLLFTDFDSAASIAENVDRFSYAMVHFIFPTSAFDMVIESIAAVFGTLKVGKSDVKLGVLTALALYFVVSFIVAYATAPV